jgi:hypothetical protein
MIQAMLRKFVAEIKGEEDADADSALTDTQSKTNEVKSNQIKSNQMRGLLCFDRRAMVHGTFIGADEETSVAACGALAIWRVRG